MKNFKLPCLMAMTGLFLLLCGCQKDEANYNLIENEYKLKRRFEIDPSILNEEGLQSKNFILDQPSLHRKVVKSFNSLNTRSGLFKLSDIQFTGYAEVSDSVRTVFSFILKTDLKDRFFHYVIEKEQNNNIREYVLEIKPLNFLSFDGDMTNFTGTISKISFNEAFNTVYDPATGRGDEHFEIIYCWKLLFENGIDKDIFNDPNSQTSSPDNGGGGGGGKYTIECVPCTCRGHNCTQSCKCSNPPYYKLVPKKDQIKSNIVSGSRNDVEECYRILITAGIISPPAGVGGETDSNPEEGIITNQLGVSQECMYKLDKNARLALAELMKNSNFISPCNPSKSSNEILGEALTMACDNATGKVTKEAIERALDGVDYVDNNISNKRLKCLWEKMMNSNNANNNVICEQIRYYEGKTKLNLSIWSQEFVGPNQDNASTGLDDNGQVTIQFNENNMKDQCDVEIIKTMIHESVHAGILNIVKGTHVNGWGVEDVPDLKYYYDNYTKFHHEYMAGSYFNKLVISLKQVFGSQYSNEIYEALMWKGLHNTSAYKKLSAEKKSKIESIWEQFNNGSLCIKSCQ